MSIKQKYLKDENGDIFSPVVSTDSVYINNKSLTEHLSMMPKLIYSYETVDGDKDGFVAQGLVFKENKSYKIITTGSFINTTSRNVTNIYMVCNNNENPQVKRTILTGYEKGSVINVFSETPYVRVLRGTSGYGAQAEVLVTYRGGYLRSNGNYTTTGSSGDSLNVDISSMIGSYSGDITKVEFKCSDGFQIQAGAWIRIFELP